MICIICGKNEKGNGYNSEPIGDGLCCEECNYNRVVPARIQENHRRQKEKSNLTTAMFSNSLSKE